MMKKLFAAALTLLALTLFSCAGDSIGDFDFSGSDISCRVVYTTSDESYTLDCRREGGTLTLVFSLPERLEGMTVRRAGETTLSFDKVEVPLASGNPIAEALNSVFSVSPDDLRSTDTVRLNGADINRLTFGTENGDVVLYILSDGKTPVRAEGEYDGAPFTLDFSEFEYLPSPETSGE